MSELKEEHAGKQSNESVVPKRFRMADVRWGDPITSGDGVAVAKALMICWKISCDAHATSRYTYATPKAPIMIRP